MSETKAADPVAPGRYTSLCFPDNEKSCFRCCPPIRPPHYDHLDYRRFLKREFWDNTRRLRENREQGHPITGFNCWGLGYLDDRHIGCLLHPFQNQGQDLRDRTGYGEKCRRELCREAVVFSRLTDLEAQWLLRLTDALDSFEYSSPQTNPVFRLLRWGPVVIQRIVHHFPHGLNRGRYREIWEQPLAGLKPEIYRFSLETCLDRIDLPTLLQHEVLSSLETTVSGFIARHHPPLMPPLDNRPFVHQLDIPESFGQFLKYALQNNRLRPSQARDLRQQLENHLATWVASVPSLAAPRSQTGCV